jgi:uncharacterized membrane protein/mono/diheme cytochrome c family protein
MSSALAVLLHLPDLANGVAEATVLPAIPLTPTRFLGRLHPIVVHFPIALVTIAALAELSRLLRRLESLSTLTLPLLALSALAAVPATLFGWLSAAWEYGEGGGDHLERHRWLGTIITVVLVALASFAWRQRHAAGLASATLAIRLGTLFCAAVVGLVGHLGGELVHGEGYLWKGLFSARRSDSTTATEPVITGTPQEVAFLTKVKPIIVKHCASCHGAEKQKGDLRLDPIGMAFDHPPDAWSIFAGQPEESELIFRVRLPRDDPDAMPPKGEGLSEAQIEAIEQWIRDGAVVPPSERSAAERDPEKEPERESEKEPDGDAEEDANLPDPAR